MIPWWLFVPVFIALAAGGYFYSEALYLAGLSHGRMLGKIDLAREKSGLTKKGKP